VRRIVEGVLAASKQYNTSQKLVCLDLLVSVLTPRPNLCHGVLARLRLDSEAVKREGVGPGVGEEGDVGGSFRIGTLKANEVGSALGRPALQKIGSAADPIFSNFR
jgi:hypothetical protein